MLATVALVVAMGGFAVARIPGSNGTISACYSKKTGALRVIDKEKRKKCRKGERALSFNQKGRTGDPGGAGARGAPGGQGGAGLPGQPGADASVTTRDSKPALIATASDTEVAFDGPSVTVEVPAGGAIVAFGISADLRNTTGGGEALANLWEGATPVGSSISCSSCVSFQATVGGATKWAPAGTHTYELRYRRIFSGTAEFQNRQLIASVLK